jgi:hypothetical protein
MMCIYSMAGGIAILANGFPTYSATGGMLAKRSRRQSFLLFLTMIQVRA